MRNTTEKSIVYISIEPPTAAFANRYFIRDCVLKGFKVEFWCVYQLVSWRSLDESSLQASGHNSDSHVIYFNSYLELIFSISNAKRYSTVFVPRVTYSGHSFFIFFLLSLFSAKLLFVAVGWLPVKDCPVTSKKARLFRLLKKQKYKQLLNACMSQIAALAKATGLVKPYDTVLFAGIKSVQMTGVASHVDSRKSRLVGINHYQFDEIANQIGVGSGAGNHIVFIDQYVPFHPDLVILGVDKVDPSIYYQEINDIFSRLESFFGLKVVIAAHPKAIMYNKWNPFDGRIIYNGNTLGLVNDAILVVTHNSAAIGYAVYLEKPIAFISVKAESAMGPGFSSLTKVLSNLLGCPLLTNDSIDKFESLPHVSSDLYKRYIFDYLGNDVNAKSSEVFVRECLRLLNQSRQK